MVVADELDVGETGGCECRPHLVVGPPAQPSPTEPGVGQAATVVVRLDPREPQVHLLGRVVHAGCLVGDVRDPGVGRGRGPTQPPGELGGLACLLRVAAEGERAARVEMGPVAGEGLTGTIDVGDQREGSGGAHDRPVGATEVERGDVAMVQRDVEAGRVGVKPAAFQHVVGRVDALDVEPTLAGGNEEPPIAGAEFERGTAAPLDHPHVRRVIRKAGRRWEPGVVGERRDTVVATLGQLLDELIARGHLAMSTTRPAARNPTEPFVANDHDTLRERFVQIVDASAAEPATRALMELVSEGLAAIHERQGHMITLLVRTSS